MNEHAEGKGVSPGTPALGDSGTIIESVDSRKREVELLRNGLREVFGVLNHFVPDQCVKLPEHPHLYGPYDCRLCTAINAITQTELAADAARDADAPKLPETDNSSG